MRFKAVILLTRDFLALSSPLVCSSADGYLGIGCLNGGHVVSDQASGVAGAIVDGVAVVGSLSGTDLVAPLPEHVAAHAGLCLREGRVLPGFLDAAVVGAGTICLTFQSVKTPKKNLEESWSSARTRWNPHSSSIHGLFAAAHALAWAWIQPGPKLLSTPPENAWVSND